MKVYHFDQFFDPKTYQNMAKPKLSSAKGHILSVVITLLVFAITYYVSHPVLNLHDHGSVIYIVFHLLIFAGLEFMTHGYMPKIGKLAGALSGIIVLAMIVLTVASAAFFRSGDYHKQLKMDETAKFDKDFKTIEMSKVPLIDYDVAKQLGDKKMGQVTALGSQYEVSDQYTLISVKGELYRVSPLEYRDFFKWFQNNDKGIPGYIKVNVTDPDDVELVELKKGMKYAPSAYFNQNMERHVRFSYPMEQITDYSFELNDEGKPYWVISTFHQEVGFYGGNSANGVILLDPVSGDMKKYDLKDVPKWVDRVQPSEFALNQLENWGLYVNGYFNTLFGQKDMLKVTDGHNYVTIDGQTNLFTGVTSVGGDKSIVGFALINLKTKEANFFKVNGADEASAMSSAEGEVQNLRYNATFPIMLNIADRPTYFISLKDQAGLVKKYAFVSVENYSTVGVGDTVGKARDSYVQRLRDAGNEVAEEEKATTDSTAVIASINTAIKDGNSTYYITLEGDDHLYVVPIKLSNELVLTKPGQKVKITYEKSKEKTVLAEKFDNLDLQY